MLRLKSQILDKFILFKSFDDYFSKHRPIVLLLPSNKNEHKHLILLQIYLFISGVLHLNATPSLNPYFAKDKVYCT